MNLKTLKWKRDLTLKCAFLRMWQKLNMVRNATLKAPTARKWFLIFLLLLFGQKNMSILKISTSTWMLQLQNLWRYFEYYLYLLSYKLVRQDARSVYRERYWVFQLLNFLSLQVLRKGNQGVFRTQSYI